MSKKKAEFAAPYFPGALFLLSAWYTKKARGPPRMKRAVWQLADGSRSLPLVNPYVRCDEEAC